MDYLSYEDTVPFVTATYYNYFKFFTKNTVLDAIQAIPDQIYGELPLRSTQSQPEPAEKGRPSSKLTPAEVAVMNKSPPAKSLLLGDTRKAQAIADYLKEIFNRVLVPIEDTTANNCLYDAWLTQISNVDYVYNNETGERYCGGDLRNQLLYNMGNLTSRHIILLLRSTLTLLTRTG